MSVLYKMTMVFAAAVLLSACAGQKSTKVVSLQKKDKSLSCKEVMLEVNEAEFYRRTAEKNKGPQLKSLLMPLGYISTYVSAEDAIGASDARIEYLNRIYEILDCDNQDRRVNHAAAAPATAIAVPQPSYVMQGGMVAAPGVSYYQVPGALYR